MDEEQRADVQELNAMNIHIARAEMNEEQRTDIRELNAMNMRIARAKMDDAQRLTARANNATTHRNARVACDALGTLNVTHQVCTNNIGSMNDECSICRAMRWTYEKRSICCDNGKNALQPFPALPEFLMQLWKGQDVQSHLFREFVQLLNFFFFFFFFFLFLFSILLK